VLYQAVQAHWPQLLEDLAEHSSLPKFVVREFEEYLRCGLLSAGCLHLVCRSCGHSQLVVLSCKRREFCPSCLGRRMTDTAVHMEQQVLPRVPVRHWICSLPWGLRTSSTVRSAREPKPFSASQAWPTPTPAPSPLRRELTALSGSMCTFMFSP